MQKIRELGSCERGNIAMLTAIMAVPLMIAIAGAVETARQTEAIRVLQTAADAAVGAAFRQPALRWRERGRMAQAHFHANIARRTFDHPVRTRFKGMRRRGEMILTFEASTKLDSLFSGFTPDGFGRVSVASSARIPRRRGSYARGNAKR